jgi:hypothetical protein
VLIVYVTPADLDWVAQRRKATDLTNAQIVLGAIEAAAADLPAKFRTPKAASRGSLFSASTAQPRRSRDRHVQLGLSGVLAGDRDVLDRLVADTGAGSLSALVRAALEFARGGQ